MAAAYVQCPGETGGASLSTALPSGKGVGEIVHPRGIVLGTPGQVQWSRCGDRNGDVGGWNSSGTQYGHFSSIPCSPVNLELESGVPSRVGRGQEQGGPPVTLW